MTTIACGLTQCGGHDLTATGWFVYLGGGLAVMAGIAFVKERVLKIPPKPDREPRTDFAPFLYDLASGQHHDAYTAKVTAVTPQGITVRRSRCCDRGHLSPAQAVAHAAAVKERIERTGR